MNSTFQPTPEQLEILHATGNIVVTAGAGTGKTETLTQRVLHLLESDDTCELHHIIALTFTDKAAGEMRQRIYQSLLKKLAAATDEKKRVRWQRLCAGFAENNRIGTFDAFNHRLLAAYPEYDLAPPQFTILTEFEERDLMASLSRAFWGWIEGLEKDDPHRMATFSLLETFGRHNLVEVIDTLAREPLGVLSELSAKHDETQFRVFFKNVMAEGEKGFRSRENRRLAKLWKTYEAQLNREFPDLPAPLVAALHAPDELRFRDSPVLTNNHTFRKKWIPAELKEECADIEASHSFVALKTWREAAKKFEERLSNFSQAEEGFEHEKQAQQVLRELAWLAVWWRKKRSETCRREGWLGFADAHDMTLRLLEEHSEVAAGLQKSCRYLMVDEFQDTNFSQWRMVDKMRTQHNVMLIGDGKQSIYGFRGGDITVFDEVRESHLQSPSLLSLSLSQRATPQLTEFFNRVFADVLPNAEDEPEAWEAPFQSLSSAHSPEKLPESGVYTIGIPYSPNGEVENGQSETAEDADKSAISRNDAEALAQETAYFLRDLQDDSDALAVLAEQTKEGTEAVEYSDWKQERFKSVSQRMAAGETGVVGVLFRSHGRKTIYETALRQAGVHFTSVKGQGFFQSPSVFDTINLLRVLFDPTDSLALVGVLRGPLVGISDVALTELRRIEKTQSCTSLWHAFEMRAGHSLGAEYSLSEGDERALSRGLERLQKWLAPTKTRLCSELLEDVLSQSELAFYDALGSDAAQRRENWGKVLELCREREELGRGGPRALAEYFQSQADLQEKEAQAELPVGGAIQLMTIHAAKGLGFAMTIVAQTDGNPQPDKSTIRSGTLNKREERYFSIKVSQEQSEENEKYEDKDKTPFWMVLQEEERARRESEFARLFYVACTRAKEFLVLVNAPENKKGSWAEMAEPHLQNAPVIAPVFTGENPSPTEQNTVLSSSPTFDVALLKPLDGNTSIAENEENMPSPGADSLREPLARCHGIALHDLLRLSFGLGQSQAVGDKSHVRKLAQSVARSAGLPLANVAVLEKQCAAVCEWLQANDCDMNKARFEVPYSLLGADGVPQNRRIDLLVPRNRMWAIVDFKSDLGGHFFNANRDEELFTKYQNQVASYGRAATLLGCNVESAFLLFVDAEGKVKAEPVD